MVWGAFSMSGKADLKLYSIVLEKSLFPLMNCLDTNNAIFQQDNTAIHTSSSQKTGLKQKILKFWTDPLSLQI